PGEGGDSQWQRGRRKGREREKDKKTLSPPIIHPLERARESWREKERVLSLERARERSLEELEELAREIEAWH
ncbi:hypothetical protein NQ272_27745, partial [Escherichia coli]|nr:hypothetical protein [Escherichia coli]